MEIWVILALLSAQTLWVASNIQINSSDRFQQKTSKHGTRSLFSIFSPSSALRLGETSPTHGSQRGSPLVVTSWRQKFLVLHPLSFSSLRERSDRSIYGFISSVFPPILCCLYRAPWHYSLAFLPLSCCCFLYLEEPVPSYTLFTVHYRFHILVQLFPVAPGINHIRFPLPLFYHLSQPICTIAVYVNMYYTL